MTRSICRLQIRIRTPLHALSDEPIAARGPNDLHRVAHRRRGRRAAESQPQLGVRAHALARHAAIRAPAPHQDRQVRAFRSSARSARSWRGRNAEQRDPFPQTRYNRYRAKPRRANEKKGVLVWLERKRQYGSGFSLKRERGWAIRWRELEIAPDGTMKRVLRYETLGDDVPRARRQTSSRKSSPRPATARRRHGLA